LSPVRVGHVRLLLHAVRAGGNESAGPADTGCRHYLHVARNPDLHRRHLLAIPEPLGDDILDISRLRDAEDREPLRHAVAVLELSRFTNSLSDNRLASSI